jgi:hypothetical protein
MVERGMLLETIFMKVYKSLNWLFWLYYNIFFNLFLKLISQLFKINLYCYI